MKYYLLKSICKYLNQFNYIKNIKRVDNNLLKIVFSKDDIFYFDMTKGNSSIFIKPNETNIKKDFIAPFDILLQKKFTNATIQKIYLLNDDKVLNIQVIAKSKYKKEILTLQFEFTGKNTNVIILNEENIILEALRHIDEDKSSRVIKVGNKLQPLPKPDFLFEQKECLDIIGYLKDVYLKKEENQLKNIKKQKIVQIQKQKRKIEKILNNLEDIKELKNKAKQLYTKGELLLSNLHKIKPYSKSVELIDFDGQTILIDIDNNFASISSWANHIFNQAKKLKQKVKNQHIEYNNLTLKIQYFDRLLNIIENATSIDEIEFYLPKKDKKQIKTKKAQPYQSFFIDGYKIMLGRDERENIYLLTNSKASDFWFHLQNQVSAHVIVSNNKKTIPQNIIEEASKICIKFSTDAKGVFKVDYTQRRNVKIQHGANVLYNPYHTITIKI